MVDLSSFFLFAVKSTRQKPARRNSSIATKSRLWKSDGGLEFFSVQLVCSIFCTIDISIECSFQKKLWNVHSLLFLCTHFLVLFGLYLFVCLFFMIIVKWSERCYDL